MEKGDTDLAKVLQERKSRYRGQSPPLDLNFVRFTFHQMVRAVDAIHNRVRLAS